MISKKTILGVLVSMLLCTGVLAQTNPGYKNVTATTGGVAFVLNTNPTVVNMPKRFFSIVSTDADWTASFWDYDPGDAGASADGFKNIGFITSDAVSETLTVKENVIYPVELKNVDFILFTGVSATADIDLYWYQ